MRIIPMPIFHGGGGSMDPESAVAMVIMINLVCILIWVFTAIFYAVKRPKHFFEEITFFGYLTYQSIAGLSAATLFVIINLIALLVWGAEQIKEIL